MIALLKWGHRTRSCLPTNGGNARLSSSPDLLGLCRPTRLLLGHDDVKELGGVDEVVVAVVA
jgi:hypothetical protein